MRRPLAALLLLAATLGAGPAVDPVLRGRELFLRTWTPWDPRAAVGGDGLGPMYNATSCVACHSQGGIGGGGPRERNVMLAAIDSDAFVVQHKNTTLAATISPPSGVKARSERNTPALYGVGLIDGISDDAIRAQLDAPHAHTTPRIAADIKGGIGRFGWKGHTAHLSEFVATACANELGLAVDGHPEGEPPGTLGQTQAVLETALRANHVGPIPGSRPDMTNAEVASLTDFVRSLFKPAEAKQQPGRDAGHKTFQEIGCAECHTETMGTVDGIYSDLLLHEMAPRLGDGASSYSVASKKKVATVVELVDKQAAPLPAEWRTPPLWGVRDSAPYLHDGRAASLDDAIRAHGGEGDFAAKAYGELTQPERLQLVSFLETLVAPSAAP